MKCGLNNSNEYTKNSKGEITRREDTTSKLYSSVKFLLPDF